MSMAAELLAIKPGTKPNWQPPEYVKARSTPPANHRAANAAKATKKAREVLIKKGEKTRLRVLNAIKQIKEIGHEATTERVALVIGASNDVVRKILNRLAKQNRVIRTGKIGHAVTYDIVEIIRKTESLEPKNEQTT